MSKSEQTRLVLDVDVLAALVPAEVLAINALVVTLATKTLPGGGTQPTDPSTLRLGFWLLAGLSVVLYILGRRPSPASGSSPASGADLSSEPAATPSGESAGTSWLGLQRWEPEDFVRVLIPPFSFAVWAMLQPASTWSSVVPGMSSATRILIGVVSATALGAVTKALAIHADLKSPAGGGAGAQAGKDNTGAGLGESPGQGTGSQPPGQGQPPENGPGEQPSAQPPSTVPVGAIPPASAAPSSAAPRAATSPGPPWVGSL